MNFKKLFVIVLLFIFSSFLISTRVDAAAVTGWAWSSNVGWVQFDTGSASPVTIATTSGVGTFSGYAWSSNIGWISFNATAGCPIMPANGTCQGKINMTTGAVTGWARACAGTINKDCASASRTDGWDGWIELSGVNHTSPDQSGNGGITFDPTTGDLKGYAFSQVIGWLQFDAKCPGCVSGPVLTATLVADPSSSVSVPLSSNLTATRGSGSTATGPITYEFKCKETDSWSSPSSSNTFPCSGSNAYTVVGTYTASARVSQGGSTAIPTATINAGNSAIGSCGPAAKTYLSTETSYSSALCAEGTPNPASPAFPSEGQSVTWMCGTSLSNCTASRQSSTPVSDNGALWITRPAPISTTKQIRVNQSVDLQWILPSTWLGCAVSSTITPANPPTVSGWTGLNVYSTTTTTLPRMRIGDFSLKINCNNGSSTNAVLIKVVDPNTGEI